MKKQMSNEQKTINQKVNKISLIILIILISISGILFLLYSVQKIYFENRFYPHVYIGQYDVSYQTKDAVRQILAQDYSLWQQQGFVFALEDQQKNKQDVIIPMFYTEAHAGDSALLFFDNEKTLEAAFSVGRNPDFLSELQELVTIFINFKSSEFPLPVVLKEDKLEEFLQAALQPYQLTKEDASFQIVWQEGNSYQINYVPAKAGYAFDVKEAIGLLKKNIDEQKHATINLVAVTESPDITESALKQLEPKIIEVLGKGNLTLTITPDDQTEKQQWSLTNKDYSMWLQPKISQDKSLILEFSREKVEKYLQDNVTEQINTLPQDAVFEMEEGAVKVTSFVPAVNGRALNIEKTFQKINTDFIEQNKLEILLEVEVAKPQITTENSNSLGIKEIVGIGESNYAGSPVNRRHNIKVGSESINNILIKPGEEFSLLNALGDIDASTGYLPELVIRDNKTTPEYGGGLCQIGTTVFRTALNTGLPITERRNHSYRVGYYEPAGTDATIYDPAPDLKFINDTGFYILLRTIVKPNDLRYEFWGTKDGRQVTIADPLIYNIVAPLPMKIIETLDLPPGEKKCTEKAHNGATAKLVRTIISSTGETKEDIFMSLYKPWQAVCLLGVEKLSEQTSP